jgi:hypothetical protein
LERPDGESQFGVLAETKRPSFRVLPLETDQQNSTPRGSLLAFMTANSEQPIKDFELTGRWRFTSVDRRFFYWSPHQTVAGSLSDMWGLLRIIFIDC